MRARRPYNPPMRKLAVLFALSLLVPSTASATWSVIAVDKSTGRVVIASATCVNRDDAFLMGVQAVIVPGKGVAACQAGVDNTHKNQMLVFAELQKGTDPKSDHRALERGSRVPVAPVRRPRPAGPKRGAFGTLKRLCLAGHPGTGAGNGDLLLDSGQHPSAGSGRAERREGVSRDERRDHRSRDGRDGSRRRLRRRQPLHVSAAAGRRIEAGHRCDGKTSHVAYILMAEPKDTNGDSHNNGKYTMYIDGRAALAARRGPRRRRHSRRRESESGEDAPRALRRVAEEAAGDVQVNGALGQPCGPRRGCGACERRSASERGWGPASIEE